MSKTPTGPEREDAQPAESSLPWEEFLGGEAAHTHEPDAHTAPAVAESPQGTAADAPAGDPATVGGGAATGIGAWPASEVPTRRNRRTGEPGSSRSGRRGQLRDAPPQSTGRGRGVLGCMAVLLVFLGLLAGGAFALQGPLTQLLASQADPADYSGTGEKEQVIVIHEGDTGEDIANTLADQDVVKSYSAFYGLLLKETPAPVFQPGAYQLKTKMSARNALDALLDPASKLERTVVIPEGTTASVALETLATATEIPLADVQAAAADIGSFGLPPEATSLEGFLFPATYRFDPGVTAHDAIKTMVDRQFTALDEAGVPPEKRWTTIVMASLVQRESGLEEDFYKVARVFYNRLDPNLWDSGLLQSDATVTYATGKTHVATTTDAERADASNPYNTYVHPGLPIGPISNPGDVAIDATVNPADGPWLYFVTWNQETRETIFSSTLQEHEAAVAKWQAWMAENG